MPDREPKPLKFEELLSQHIDGKLSALLYLKGVPQVVHRATGVGEGTGSLILEHQAVPHHERVEGTG